MSYIKKKALSIPENGITYLLLLLFAIVSQYTIAQERTIVRRDDSSLLDSFVSSKGYTGVIQFSSSNIKQFWVDKSVFSLDDEIKILLENKKRSNPLKIMLANVNMSQDCRIDIIADTKDFDFLVTNSKNTKNLSTSSNDNDFIQYAVKSSVFHLEDINDFAFNIVFHSDTQDALSIKRIILSFSNNTENFVRSPGEIKVSTVENASFRQTSDTELIDESSFKVTGRYSKLYSNKKIIVSEKEISNSIAVKNVGKNVAHIYFGYTLHTKEGKRIGQSQNPYMDNHTIKIDSAEAGSNKIIVDSDSNWEKGCCLALDAKEDYSDFPNFSIVDGQIQKMSKIDDTHYEIEFNKDLKNGIEKGSLVRIHSPAGAANIYTHSLKIQPGTEKTLSSKIKKDESFLQFNPKALSKGVYYIVPFVFSYTVDSVENNTVLISDFIVLY